MNENVLSCYETAKDIMLGMANNSLVMNDAVFPSWIDKTQCFWYKCETKKGKEYRLVDTKNTKISLAFDHQSLADSLTKKTKKSANPEDLPIRVIDIKLSPLAIHFQAYGKYWKFDPESKQCEQLPQNPENTSNILKSPDGKKSVFICDYNLWVKKNDTGEKHALTSDGTKDFPYACDISSANAQAYNSVQAVWSPDSKRIFTLKLDLRDVATRTYTQYVPCGSLQPQTFEMKMAYPGDKKIETYQLYVIEIESKNILKVDYPALPIPGCNLTDFFSSKSPMGWWSPDNQRAFFVDVSRGAKAVRIVELDTHVGGTRVLFEETSETFVRLVYSTLSEPPLFMPLPETDELIWFSERTGWGHLYLYDLKTGKLKHPITEGEWLVRDTLHYDKKQRELLIQTAGRDKEISPYYRDICKLNIDSGKLIPLVSGNFDYAAYPPYCFNVLVRGSLGVDSKNINCVSPCSKYIVTTRSRVDIPPVSLLIDRDGKEIMTIETADISGLPDNWLWPEPVKLKAADDKTDIYGVVFRPPGYSSDKQYPVIDFSCGIRNHSCVPHGSFGNAYVMDIHYNSAAAIAALGFIVVAIEARGTPYRDKAFQDHNYGNCASDGEPADRIAGLQQLAIRYPYMDLNRVGISSGDNVGSAVYALLNYPVFYKVAVLHCFTDPRFNWAAIGESFEGIPFNNEKNKSVCYAEELAESLKGKLFLIHGMLDPLTPTGTFRLVEALQKANKDFDMLCLPTSNHDVPTYAVRRNWDYLVKHLQGIDPPHEFSLKSGIDLLHEKMKELNG